MFNVNHNTKGACLVMDSNVQDEKFSHILQTIAWLTSRYVRGETSGGRSPNTAPRPTNGAEGESWDTDGVLLHMYQT